MKYTREENEVIMKYIKARNLCGNIPHAKILINHQFYD